jgi:hypothetical protein
LSGIQIDHDALLTITGVTIRNAIWVCRSNLLDAELEALRDLREEENYAKLILRGVLKRGVL